VPPLVDPRAVEMNIFADLTTSKRQKEILFANLIRKFLSLKGSGSFLQQAKNFEKPRLQLFCGLFSLKND
jgi:hypothetical protein